MQKYRKGNKDTVTIAEALCTARDYAMLNSEKVPGVRTFTGWNKTGDFVISADTTVTGSWAFTPEKEPKPEERASFTVRCLLKDGTPIADEKTVTGQTVGREMTAKAKTIDGYRLISDELITITLQAGDNNIFTFYYEKIAEQEPVKEETPKDALKDAPTDPPAPASESAPLNADPQPDRKEPAE